MKKSISEERGARSKKHPFIPLPLHPLTPSPHRLWQQTAVLLLAAAIRLFRLHDVPPGLAQDEVLNADIVTFIRNGEHALFFRHGFGHEPLYHYFAVPFQIVLGDNVLSIRLPAFILGMLLVALTMRWVRRDFGGQTAVFTGVALALSWWPIIFSRIGLRPIMEPLFLVAAVYFWKRPWLAGLFLGLSFYTYTGARVVLLIPLLFAIAYWIIQRFTIDDLRFTKDERPPFTIHHLPFTIHHSLFIFFLATLIALPMQLALWRDPTLQQRVDQLSGPLEALQSGNIGPIWQTITATLGVFSLTGDPRWTYMVAERPLFTPILAILFHVGLLLAIWRIRQPRYLLILVWLGVTLIPSAITPQAPSTIRIIGAMPVVYLLLAIGLTAVLQIAGRKLPGVASQLLVAGYAVLLLLPTINSGFIQWPTAPETQEKYQTALLNMSRYWQSQSTVTAPVVADAFYEPIDADSFQRNLGRDPQARWVQFPPNGGAVVWPEASATELLVPEFAPLPTDLQAMAGIASEPKLRAEATPSFAVYVVPPYAQTAVSPPQAVTFNNAIQLIGVEMVATERPLLVYTYWQVLAPLPWDLTAFVHVLGDEPAPVTQHDGFDVAAERLLPGDIVLQRHLLPYPFDVERPYRINIGLYTSADGVRWQPVDQPTDSWIYKDNFIFDQNAVGE